MIESSIEELFNSINNSNEYKEYKQIIDIIDKDKSKYTFMEAKDIVIKALSVLGDDYVKLLNRAFDEKWIDVYHSKGKRSGAYSSGSYDVNPYVLLNFEGSLNDVSTIAHELGHSMHTYLSCKNNPYCTSSYKIFVAEVASLVNELLLANYMLNNSNDKNEKLNIINHILELYKSTLFRQTMFAEFEKITHEKREEGVILTSDYLSNVYYDLVKKYFGENVVCDELIKYEWARIPHFYTPFYVYQYATGFSAAIALSGKILREGEEAVEQYKKFLSGGCSKAPVELLKIAGVNLEEPTAIQDALDVFGTIIDEMEALVE